MSGARELIEYIESHAREKVNETLPRFRFRIVLTKGDLKGFICIWFWVFRTLSTVNKRLKSFCDDFFKFFFFHLHCNYSTLRRNKSEMIKILYDVFFSARCCSGSCCCSFFFLTVFPRDYTQISYISVLHPAVCVWVGLRFCILDADAVVVVDVFTINVQHL